MAIVITLALFSLVMTVIFLNCTVFADHEPVTLEDEFETYDNNLIFLKR